MMGAIAITLPLWLTPSHSTVWAQSACGDDSLEASYDTDAGRIDICDSDELVTIDDSSLYTLEFINDEEVAVRADCNRATGTYTQMGNELAITLGPTTLAACPPGSFSDRYLETLQGATGYFMQDGDLYIDLKADTGTMMFSSGDWALSRADSLLDLFIRSPNQAPTTSWRLIHDAD